MLRNFQQFVEAIFLAESKFAKNVEASLMRELEIVDDEKYSINSFNKNKNDNNNSIDGIGIGKQQEQTTQNIRSALTSLH